MTLARRLFESDRPELLSAFNFGPEAADARTVRDLVQEAFSTWSGTAVYSLHQPAMHEAGLLTLATSKARAILGWCPQRGFRKAVAESMAWYLAVFGGTSPRSIAVEQLGRYASELRQRSDKPSPDSH